MATPEPDGAPKPDKKAAYIAWPLVFNAIAMLIFSAVAAANSGSSRGEMAFIYFSLLVGLLLANVVAAVVAAIAGKHRAAKEFLFSVLGIFLIGLGTCAILS